MSYIIYQKILQKICTLLALCAFAVLCPSKALWAGSITATLDRTEGSLDEAFLLTITIEGSPSTQPEIPQIDGLNIANRGYSQSSSWVNGKQSSTVSMSLMLQAERPGTYTIPSIALEIDGKKEATLPLNLTVSGPGQRSQNSAAQNQGSPQSNDQTQNENAKKADKTSNIKGVKTGGVFIERECSTDTPYVGEQIICKIRIYHLGNLNGGQRLSQNSADFRRFTLEGEQHGQKVLNGRRYGVIELVEIVVPLKEGEQKLPPFGLDARIVTMERRRNPLDQFFDRFGGGVFEFDMNVPETKQYNIQSEETILKVKPTPSDGRPANYKGIVGNFNITSSLSQNQIQVGDTATTTISLNGQGFLDTVAEPQIKVDPSLKIYADKPEYKESADKTSGIQSSKVFKYAFVPSKPGSYNLGSVEIPVFNPKLGSYISLRADLGTLIVTPNKAEEKPVAVGGGGGTLAEAAKQNVKELGKDLLGPHDLDLLMDSQELSKNALAVLASLSGLALICPFGLAGFTSFRRTRSPDMAKTRRSRAYKTFKKIDQDARQLIKQNKADSGLALGSKGFRAYLGDRLNIQGTALTLKEVPRQLTILDVKPEVSERVVTLLEKFERMEFSGVIPDASEAVRWMDELDSVVGEIES